MLLVTRRQDNDFHVTLTLEASVIKPDFEQHPPRISCRNLCHKPQIRRVGNSIVLLFTIRAPLSNFWGWKLDVAHNTLHHTVIESFIFTGSRWVSVNDDVRGACYVFPGVPTLGDGSMILVEGSWEA